MKSLRWRAIEKAERKRSIKKECFECGEMFYALDQDEECCGSSCYMQMVGIRWSDLF